MDIKQTLLTKAKNDELGHFYILKSAKNQQSNDFLRNWALDFCTKHLNSFGGNFNLESIQNHEDLLIISQTQKETGNYKLTDFSDLFSFLNYKATRADRKLIIIESANKLSQSVANKLLKTLEEPPVKCTIFLLNATNASLLNTITSRGIQIRIPSQNQITHEQNLFTSLIDQLKNGLASDEFINEYRYDKELEQKLFIDFNRWCLTNNTPLKLLWEIDQLNKEYHEDLIFNGAPLHRLNKLYHLMRQAL